MCASLAPLQGGLGCAAHMGQQAPVVSPPHSGWHSSLVCLPHCVFRMSTHLSILSGSQVGFNLKHSWRKTLTDFHAKNGTRLKC